MPITRPILLDTEVSLEFPGWRTPVPQGEGGASAVRIAAELLVGSWGSASLKVQYDSGLLTFKDFASPKVLDGTTKEVEITAAELRGVDRLVLVQDADAAGGIVRVRASAETGDV